MERLQAAWLHQKFCKGKTITHVTEPGGIIAEMLCSYCMISLWKIGDETDLSIVNDEFTTGLKARPQEFYDSRRYTMPNRSYMTTSGEYDPLLGRCDLCEEITTYVCTDCKCDLCDACFQSDGHKAFCEHHCLDCGDAYFGFHACQGRYRGFKWPTLAT